MSSRSASNYAARRNPYCRICSYNCCVHGWVKWWLWYGSKHFLWRGWPESRTANGHIHHGVSIWVSIYSISRLSWQKSEYAYLLTRTLLIELSGCCQMRSAMRSLGVFDFQSRLAYECLYLFQKGLSMGNLKTLFNPSGLMWHSGLPGNEKTDALVKLGIQQTLTGF